MFNYTSDSFGNDDFWIVKFGEMILGERVHGNALN